MPAAAVFWIEVGNAALYTGMAVRERCCKPGLLTGLGLIGTHAVAGALALHRSGRLDRRRAFAAFALGIAVTSAGRRR